MIDDRGIRKIVAAAKTGISNGRDDVPNRLYRDRCSWFHPKSGAQIIYTRDTGHHSSGWMKNPDFESCWHLSLSFREPYSWPDNRVILIRSFVMLGGGSPPRDYDEAAAREIARDIMGEMIKLSWIESAKSARGIFYQVRHYRTFCDASWLPIRPRGEVYSKRNTPADWKSWSELTGERPSHVDAD